MLIEVPPAQRASLRPLFSGFPGLYGCIDAALEGKMGAAWADHPARPTVALIDLDFGFLAGDPDAPAAEEAVRGLEPPWSAAVSSAAWEPLLRRVWGERVRMRTRVAFHQGAWDRARLRGFVEALPDGYELRRITIDDAARFRELADSLVYNFPSLEEFVARGVGFGVEREGRFVSGCSSFAIKPAQPGVRDPDASRLSPARPRLCRCRGDDRALHRSRSRAVLGCAQPGLRRAGGEARLRRAVALHRIRAARLIHTM